MREQAVARAEVHHSPTAKEPAGSARHLPGFIQLLARQAARCANSAADPIEQRRAPETSEIVRRQPRARGRIERTCARRHADQLMRGTRRGSSQRKAEVALTLESVVCPASQGNVRDRARSAARKWQDVVKLQPARLRAAAAGTGRGKRRANLRDATNHRAGICSGEASRRPRRFNAVIGRVFFAAVQCDDARDRRGGLRANQFLRAPRACTTTERDAGRQEEVGDRTNGAVRKVSRTLSRRAKDSWHNTRADCASEPTRSGPSSRAQPVTAVPRAGRASDRGRALAGQ